MKDIIKLLGILLTGLFVAIFFYPFLHESGHAVASVLCGAELHEFHLFPLPYVVCNVYSLGNIQQSFIGIFGMLLPLIFSLFIRTKKFWFWLITCMIKGISAMAFGISYIAILCYESGIVWQNEDIIKVIRISQTKSSIWLVIMLVMFCITFVALYFNNPLKRIEKYFGVV